MVAHNLASVYIDKVPRTAGNVLRGEESKVSRLEAQFKPTSFRYLVDEALERFLTDEAYSRAVWTAGNMVHSRFRSNFSNLVFKIISNREQCLLQRTLLYVAQEESLVFERILSHQESGT